ncbi:MAG: hypothetical protein KF819_03925 [Labilithrix sp.]|nr:hypothetical protein [Labilithrix sp.]
MNPYAPPKDADRAESPVRRGDYHARLAGDVLVVGKGARLPPVCLKCGARDGVSHRHTKFSWTPVWARLSVLLCTLLGLIAILVTTKKGELGVPLCVSCNARWTAGRNAVIGGVVMFVGGILLLRVGDDPTIGFGVLGVGFVAFLALTLGVARPRMLQVRKIDDQYLELKGFHQGAAREIADGASA